MFLSLFLLLLLRVFSLFWSFFVACLDVVFPPAGFLARFTGLPCFSSVSLVPVPSTMLFFNGDWGSSAPWLRGMAVDSEVFSLSFRKLFDQPFGGMI